MITIEVFHGAFEDVPIHVATLRSNQPLEQALEMVFTATQNLEQSWVQVRNRVLVQVTAPVLERGACRSTSMGDYVRVVDENGNESFWRCCAVGWKAITNREDLKRVQDAAIFAGI